MRQAIPNPIAMLTMRRLVWRDDGRRYSELKRYTETQLRFRRFRNSVAAAGGHSYKVVRCKFIATFQDHQQAELLTKTLQDPEESQTNTRIVLRRGSAVLLTIVMRTSARRNSLNRTRPRRIF